MTPLETENLILRNWKDSDQALFHEINHDDAVMRYFPFRRDEQQSAELLERLKHHIDRNGYGFCAIELKSTGECAGFCGIENTEIENVFPKGTIEIGWRLSRHYWGHGIATEAGRAWLEFGFENKDFREIVSFAVHNNDRSTAVMKRLGLKIRPEREFLHPAVPDTHPHLQRHVVYTITADEWSAHKKRAVSPPPHNS